MRRQRATGRERLGNLQRQVGRETSAFVDAGELAQLPSRSALSSCSSSRRSAASESRCELTDTYSPAAIDSAPATSPAIPAVTIAVPEDPDAATPSTRLAVETIPSLAPSTAALSQFAR